VSKLAQSKREKTKRIPEYNNDNFLIKTFLDEFIKRM
jgi:hypothetical protein